MVDQPHPALVLDAASLVVPVVNADARLLDLLRRYADDVLARRAGKDDLVVRAERWILENLHTGHVGVTRLARSLGMSDRTLARRLAEDGLTPAGLVDDLRRRLADRYLAERAFALGRITYLLGYSDLSAFTRAFRRWTVERRRSGGRRCCAPRSPRHHQPRRRKEAPFLSGIRADRQTGGHVAGSRFLFRAAPPADMMAGNVKWLAVAANDAAAKRGHFACESEDLTDATLRNLLDGDRLAAARPG